MNINWVVSNSVRLPAGTDLTQIKNIGSLWGGWKTWKTCQTDNVICHDPAQAQLLIDTGFATKCNFYIPQALYQSLETAPGVMAYGGEFLHEIDNPEEIIAMHLASTAGDVILLLGFDWTAPTTESQQHYFGMIHHVIQSTPKTQWVMINPPAKVADQLTKLDNFSTDIISNVFGLLSN